MKTLQPVDEETYARIGKAYLICSEHPDVFGAVTMEKFCSMFVDVVPEGENERVARIKASVLELYDALKRVLREMPIIAGDSRHDTLIYAVSDAQALIDSIDGEESDDE